MTGQPDGTDVCSGPNCRAIIRWVLTEAGRRMPIDPTPHPAGNIVRVDIPGVGVRARVLGGGQLPVLPPAQAWRQHRVTCPAAVAERAKSGGVGPRCADPACGLPMDPDLAVREQWRVHPSCTDPAAPRPTTPPSSPAQCGEALPGLDGPDLGGAR